MPAFSSRLVSILSLFTLFFTSLLSQASSEPSSCKGIFAQSSPRLVEEVSANIHKQVVTAVKSTSLLNRDQSLLNIARHDIHNLSIKEVVFISAHMGPRTLRDKIRTFFGRSSGRLFDPKEARNSLIEEFSAIHAPELTIQQILQLSHAAGDRSGRASLISNYSRSRAIDLTAHEVIELAASIRSSEAENLLVEFVKGQHERLSKREILNLTEASREESVKSFIVRRLENRNNAILGEMDSVDQIIEYTSTLDIEQYADLLLLEFTQKNVRELTSDDAISLSQAANASASQAEILFQFAAANANRLTPAEIVELAQNADTSDASDNLLERFAKKYQHTLSPQDAVLLANATSESDVSDRMVNTYALNNIHRLNTDEILMLAKNVSDSSCDQFLAKYVEYRIKTLQVEEFIAIIKQISEGEDIDPLLIKYVETNAGKMSQEEFNQLIKYSAADDTQNQMVLITIERRAANLSVAAAIALADKAYTSEGTDAALIAFANSQQKRLKVSDLIQLEKALNSDDGIIGSIIHGL